jgi:hypothetical protein
MAFAFRVHRNGGSGVLICLMVDVFLTMNGSDTSEERAFSDMCFFARWAPFTGPLDE